MVKSLIKHIQEKGIQELAIIGMAKNAGKTVTFNQVIKEAQALNLKLALLSYGRDGEEIDALTNLKKPRIAIPPGAAFATADQLCAVSSLRVKTLAVTGIKTLLGEIKIYQNLGKMGNVELVGVNSSSKLQKIKELLPAEIELLIVDGALDRRSSAVPELTQGFILATGAVIGNSVTEVAKGTRRAIKLLTLPVIKNPSLLQTAKKLFASYRNGIMTKEKELISLEARLSLANISELAEDYQISDLEVLFLQGALTNKLVENLIFSRGVKGIKIIVRDATRVFLHNRNLNLLQQYNISLEVLNGLVPVAVTVNPVSPYGVKLNSALLVKELREQLGSIPVYDLLSKEYQSIVGGDGNCQEN